MEIIASLFAAAVVCFMLFGIYTIAKTDDNKVLLSSNIASNSNDNCNNNDSWNKEKCKDLCIKLVRKLNCEVDVDERDDSLDFSFQGAHFKIIYGRGVIRIWHLFWYKVDLEDIEMLSKVRRIINEMNLEAPEPCISYVINDELQKMYVHSSMDTLFIKEIPDIEQFLISRFDSFFHKVYDFNSRIVQKEGVKAGNNAKE